jgi:hypothetical protein
MEDCLEAPLKQRPDSTVLSIEPNAVADIQPMDCVTKVCLAALQLQMVVVAH